MTSPSNYLILLLFRRRTAYSDTIITAIEDYAPGEAPEYQRFPHRAGNIVIHGHMFSAESADGALLRSRKRWYSTISPISGLAVGAGDALFHTVTILSLRYALKYSEGYWPPPLSLSSRISSGYFPAGFEPASVMHTSKARSPGCYRNASLS